MSNALALAAVTAVLKDLLDNALIDHSVSAHVGGPVTVTALPPNRLKLGNDEKTQLNLFLYHVAPNSGWSNSDLPARDERGQRLTNPPLALNLYYILMACGREDFEAEILLGYAMQMLHETPVLQRDAIRKALAQASPVSGGILPATVGALSASDLAEQVELIKLTPQPMSTEELSKLWSAFQAPYRPSAAYHVSVVLIEGTRSTRSALPVRARNLYLTPFRQPFIEQVVSPGGVGQPIVAGSPIVIKGHQLQGDVTRVRLGESELSPAAKDIGDSQIKLTLPTDLSAGVHGLQVVHQTLMGTPPVAHQGVESNVAAFVLHPTVTATFSAGKDGKGTGKDQGKGNDPQPPTITFNFNPPVGKSQRVILLLNELQPPPERAPYAYSFSAPARNQPEAPERTPSIVISMPVMRAGKYLVRAQVDGAESPLSVNATTGQYDAPQVTIT